MSNLIKYLKKEISLDEKVNKLKKMRRDMLNRIGNPITKKCTYCKKTLDIKNFELVNTNYATPSINSRCIDCAELFYMANLLRLQYPNMTIKEIMLDDKMMELKKSQLLNYKLNKIIRNGKK
jgi:hypothetical protein